MGGGRAVHLWEQIISDRAKLSINELDQHPVLDSGTKVGKPNPLPENMGFPPCKGVILICGISNARGLA